MPANESNDGSIVGVRASWRCYACGAIEKTYQLHKLGAMGSLELPPGWSIVAQVSLCAAHGVDGLLDKK